MTMLSLRYDLRLPDFAGHTMAEAYAECLRQCEWADEAGFNTIVVSEHHGLEDGYLPAPLTMAGAIAGRTSKAMITISALLVPLYDPLRLAEDIAVLDLASGGRLSIVAGLGYRWGECEMFGIERSERGALLEQNLNVMRQAWTGEPFEHRGRTVRVTPTPLQKPHPVLLVGGSTEIAAKRAARLRLPFMPAIGDPELAELYNAECERVGFSGGWVMLPAGPGFVHVTEDPERDWARIAPHAMFEAQTYASWQTPGQRSTVTTYAKTVDELSQSGVYAVVTPEECLALAERLGPTGSLVFHPLMGGLPPELGWESLQLLADKVLPKLASAAA